jgi:branched-chain amino acid transport system substrate-binding protein
MERKVGRVLTMVVCNFLLILFGTHPLAMAKEVKIGAAMDLTGPVAYAAQVMWKSTQDYFAWAEKNHPIPGVEVKLLIADAARDPSRYLPAFKKFNEEGVVLLTSCSSDGTAATYEFCNRVKVPAIQEGSGFPPAIVPPGYTFLNRPLYPDFFAVACIHFMDQWKKAGHKEKPKAIFITWDNAYGKGPVELGTPWAEKYGFEMLPTQLYARPPQDLSVELLKAKDLGANLVYMNSVQPQFAVLLKDAKRLGLTGKMQFCGGSETRDKMVIEMVGDAAEGAWSITSWPDFSETGERGIKNLRAIQEATHGQVYEESSSYFLGLCPGRVMHEAIRLAAQKFGPEKVTKETMYETLKGLKNLDMLGFCPNVSYSETERRPYKEMNISKVKDGKWVKERYLVDAPGLMPGK